MNIPHGISAQRFIDWVNVNIQKPVELFGGALEARRSRVLLAEVLLRLEKIEKILKEK
ncbi:MAG: hypothetical protein KCHDKBKB_00668 [Elusimicrobia bacterium]|nr:hypothetical protein [Elusimicrobiota bacterium]